MTTRVYTLYKCSCGAYGIDDGTKEIKWAENLQEFNKYTKLNLKESNFKNAETCYMCDYCVNHWGMDLCKCGSGKKIHECECKCNLPAQTYKKQEKRALWVY